MKNRAVVLLSGGMDSAALLYEARACGFDSFPIFVYYGQRAADEEVRAAVELSATLGKSLEHVVLPDYREMAPGALTGACAVPEATQKRRAVTVVPCRNLHLIAWAASYAAKIGADWIFFGATWDDREIYPDCRQEFLINLEQALFDALPDRCLQIYRPWIALGKLDVLRRGLELGVPYELTWSCYRGGGRPCRTCDACASRAAVWAEVGRPDPALEMPAP